MLPTSLARISIPIASIDASNRIRQDYSHVEELSDSIRERGLLQPIVVTLDHRLVAGGSRLQACKLLGWETIDVVYIESVPEDVLRILEVEENIRRKDFSWQERVLAVARVHDCKWKQAAIDPQSATWTQRQTGELLGVSVGHVNNCTTLAKLILSGDPAVLACEGVQAALKLLLERKEIEANKRLALLTLRGPVVPVNTEALLTLAPPSADIFSPSTFIGGAGIGLAPRVFLPGDSSPLAAVPEPAARHTVSLDADRGTTPPAIGVAEARGAAAPNQPDLTATLQHICRLGDCLEVMKTLEPVDHIITDIPYGIDMGMLQQPNTGMDVSATAAEHDVVQNIELMKRFIPASYNTLKENGFLIIWYDLDHHNLLQQLGAEAGFKVQRWPLVWVKTSTCLNQAAQFNFTKTTEFAMVLRKGKATLTAPQLSNFWMGARETDPRVATHPFAKPLALWKWLFNAVALKGQTILDPFAGCGSSTLAALEHGFAPIACELNPAHHATLVQNVHNFYTSCLKMPQKS